MTSLSISFYFLSFYLSHSTKCNDDDDEDDDEDVVIIEKRRRVFWLAFGPDIAR